MSRAPSDDGPSARRQRTLLDFATVDDGASAHDAHLDAALADFDDEFTALQIQSGRLDGKRPAEGGAEGRD